MHALNDFLSSLVAAAVVVIVLCPMGYGSYVRAKRTARDPRARYVMCGIYLLAAVAVLVVASIRGEVWRMLPLVVVLDGYFLAMAAIHMKMAGNSGDT